MLLAAVLLLTGGGLTAATAAAPVPPVPAGLALARVSPAAARSCSLTGDYNRLGATYVETLRVADTTCATGVATVKAYMRCRTRAGGVKGYCHARVNGFSCRERRTSGPVQFEASVTCTRSRESVDFAYSENT
jgi:hypothetical protein